MTIFTQLVNKNKQESQEEWQRAYETFIETKIRKKYSIGQELAIQRKRDVEPEEFAIYNAYVEKCKEEVKAEFLDVE